MKERFEGLTAWREKQQEERNFLESKLEDARKHIDMLTLQNQELSRKTTKDWKGIDGGSMVRINTSELLCFSVSFVTKKHKSWKKLTDLQYIINFKVTVAAHQDAELDLLRAQVARLQVEKNDLVAMNSELQLKADQDSQDDSFIEVIRVSVKISTNTRN